MDITLDLKTKNRRYMALLQRTLKNYALWKHFQGALNLGPSQRILQNFFSKVRGYIYALWKNFENQILHGLLYFSFSKTIIDFENESISSNVKCFIDDSINCTFICQGFDVISLRYLHRLCRRYSHTLYTGNFVLPLPDIFGHKSVVFVIFSEKPFLEDKLDFFLVWNRNLYLQLFVILSFCHFVFLSFWPKLEPCL